MNKQSINPITLRGPRSNITLSRLHYGAGKIEAKMQFVITLLGAGDVLKPEQMTFAEIDESLFINGIGHLFPGGELRFSHLLAPAIIYPFETVTYDIPGEAYLGYVINACMTARCWFAVMPLPDDQWRITVKDENAAFIAAAIVDAVKRAPQTERE